MKYKRLFALISIMLLCTFSAYAEGSGYIVKFKTVPAELDTTIFEGIIPEEGLYKVDSLEYLDRYKEMIEYTEKDEPVDFVLPDEIIIPEYPEPKISLMALPSDNLYGEQWALNMVKAEYAWENETYGNEIRVAVIDSGCYPHGDLGDKLITGKNYMDNTSDTSDKDGHGTHVSGIIAAGINGRGTVGVAPKVKIVPIKVIEGETSCTISQAAKAIRDSVDFYGCRVLNMSWTVEGNYDTLKDALNYAYNNGAILVAAVGNEGKTDLAYPAAYNNVVGVGSVDSDKVKSDFSRYNKSVDIMAPGANVLSLYTENRYAYMSGTSMASPHIAGIAALALSADSSITPAEFYTMLTQTAEDLGTAGKDIYYGYGLVNTQAIFDRIFQKRSFYISPTNTQNGKSYYLVRNTSDTPFTLNSYFADYSGTRLVSATKDTITLKPTETTIIQLDTSSRHFLWNNLSPLK